MKQNQRQKLPRKSSRKSSRKICCPNTKCPNPLNIQTFEMAHANGVTSGYSPTVGFGSDSEGNVIRGIANTRHQTTSKLANLTAPPENDEANMLFWVVTMPVYLISGWLFFTKVMDSYDYNIKTKWGIFLAGFIFDLFLLITVADYESKKYLKEVEEWSDSWICLSCGSQWIQK